MHNDCDVTLDRSNAALMLRKHVKSRSKIRKSFCAITFRAARARVRVPNTKGKLSKGKMVTFF